MKASIRLLRFLALCGASLCFAACVTTTTTTTDPDGTVTVTKTSAPDAESVAAVAGVAGKVIAEK